MPESRLQRDVLFNEALKVIKNESNEWQQHFRSSQQLIMEAVEQFPELKDKFRSAILQFNVSLNQIYLDHKIGQQQYTTIWQEPVQTIQIVNIDTSNVEEQQFDSEQYAEGVVSSREEQFDEYDNKNNDVFK